MIEIPDALKKEEFAFVLVESHGKKAVEVGWTNKIHRFDDPILLSHLSRGGNYGVLCGYNNLLVVDFDDADVQAEVCQNLPNTLTILTGSGKLHKYFHCENVTSFNVNNSVGERIADIQGKGRQVIAPNSIHPNGNIYSIVDTSPIADIEYAELKALFSKWDVDAPPEKTWSQIKSPPNPTLELIKTKIPISQLLQSYNIPTNRNPTLCPLHSSKGGKCLSFNDSKGLWHCFHCNKGGSIFDLFMLKENVDFNKSAEALAEKSGLAEQFMADKTKWQRKNRQTPDQSLTLKIDNYYDNAELFWQRKPYFYDRTGLFWVWNTDLFKWEIVDETDILRLIDQELQFGGQLVTAGIKNAYMEAFKQVGRGHIPENLPEHIIQFKDKFFNIRTKELTDATPEFFACNPINWNIGMWSETPHIDKLFTEWVGEEYKDTLYEMVAYCCLPSYPIPLIFTLVGTGANGKSTLLQLITRFVGVSNSTSCELDVLLESRFECARLYKKLVCFVGETNFGLLTKTSLLKKLTGSDLIGYEFKNKQPFEGYNYAKILISTNNLPITEDTQDGFYRRWMVIRFPNQFTISRDVLESVPDSEYEALARKVTEILPTLINKGLFSKQGTFAEQKERYITFSNPLGLFWKERIVETKSEKDYLKYGEVYQAYMNYLREKGVRVISKKEFTKTLEMEGIYVSYTSRNVNGEWIKDRWIDGITFGTLGTLGTPFSTLSTHIEKELGLVSHQSQVSQEIAEEVVTGGEICDTNTKKPPIENTHPIIDTKKDILELLKKYPEGIKKWLLVSLLKAPNEQIDLALRRLCSDGEIYEPRQDYFILRD